MKKNRLYMAVLSMLLAACVTAPVQPRRPAPGSVPGALPAALADVDDVEFRKSLEEAYEQIVARAEGSSPVIIVDADALLSMPVPDHKSIRGAIQYFSTSLRDSIQASLNRSQEYRAEIEEALTAARLPRGLAYLPVIESAYLPALTSRAGARGVWQFMPDTAREYGMRVDWWVDDRVNPSKSAKAAATYLGDLYREFNDWPLALAAYNAGPGRIRRALRETGSSTFWELLERKAIPKETRGYVPTFYATLMIVSDPPAYGFRLPAQRDDRPELEEVEVTGPVSADFLAEVAGLESSLMRSLNPEFRNGILPPGRTAVRLPRTNAGSLRSRANTIHLEDPIVDVTSFTMRRGDTLTKLASTIGVSAQEIMLMNSVQRDHFGPGDSLYLPVSKLELSQCLSSASSPADQFHKVEPGETLYSIARRNGLSVEDLLNLNDLRQQHVLRPGERLRVRAGTALTSGGM